MTDVLSYTATFAAIALLGGAAASRVDGRIGWIGVLLFAGYLGLDDLATALGSQSGFDLLGGEWNWSGKAYSLLLAVAAMVTLRLDARAVGLRMPERSIGAASALTAVLLVASVALALVFQPEAPSTETLAFQATMPALAEELAYRGIAPALLLGLLHGKRWEGGVPWAVVMATAAMFGLWHGLGYDDGGYAFEWIPALYTCIGSVAYGWMRFATGSLLFPVLAHALGNLVFQLVPLLR
jgi:membrane protease YdiL (CAAX protease family)